MASKIPLAAMEKILEEANAPRISKSSKEELRKACEEYVEKITNLSATFARHSNRQTIKEKDVELALKQLNN